MRIAAIDTDTNSMHMIVGQVRQDLSFEVIDREKEMVRLGAGGLDGRSLTPTAMTAALQTLAKFKRLADSHKVDEIVASATSATREADNGGDFIAEAVQGTGIQVRVISGAEEARLNHHSDRLRLVLGRAPAGSVLRNRRVAVKTIHRIRKRLSGVDLDARLHMPGLDPRRADIAVAGSILLDTILRRLNANQLTLCDLALREGLVLDYIHRNTSRIRK